MSEQRFLKALKGEKVDRPPLWFMRQAGRYLPEYIELRNKYTFFERVKTKELACEITLQPIRRFELDAAIIFSDILVLLECLDVDVQIKPGFGPLIESPLRSEKQAFGFPVTSAKEKLNYVYEAIRLTASELGEKTPLIGFAGAPWTLFCYLVEGKGSKTFSVAKSFLFSQANASHHILDIMTDLTIEYLHEQVKAGAKALQVFESWAAALAPQHFEHFAVPYLKRICEEDYGVPLILFCKDAEWSYPLFKETNVAGFGIGWGCTPNDGRTFAEGKTVQGNLDPSVLFANPRFIRDSVTEMIDNFGTQNYIANLGHGILPETPVEHVEVFVDAVKSYKGE